METPQLTVALDMMVAELKRAGQVHKEAITKEVDKKLKAYHLLYTGMNKPEFTLKQRTALVAKNRSKILTILKVRTSRELAFKATIKETSAYAAPIYTSDSIRAFNAFIKELFTHPDEASFQAEHDRLHRLRWYSKEGEQRIALMDYDLKALMMDFISGETPMHKLPEELTTFESTIY